MKQEEIELRVRAGYDQLPYPGINGNIDPKECWAWVNINWIGSLMPTAFNGDPPFKRILVAGCGTGNEAFQMQNSFPNAEITAVDYSEESIRIAQKHQNEHPHYANIRFEVGDLTVEESNWVKAGYYDFISCHGAMSYIPNAQNVFDLFAKCLSEEGIFYLGANGATHCGIKVRKSFESLGYNPNKFKDTLETRRLIELFDRLSGQQSHLAAHTPTYIDSDILNTFSLNLALSEWGEYAERSGLHFVSSAEFIPALGKTLSPNIFSLLVPRSRKELCELVAINTNVAFHRLVFSKKIPPPIPWNDPDALLDCEFQTTWFYSIQNPISDIYGELMLNAKIASGYTIDFRWPIDEISLKLLRQQDGSRRIKDVLGDSLEVYKDDAHALLVKLFMFHQLGIIKILPTPSIQDSNNA
ncbi:MAG: SAM-dependent methyltransferase [Lentimonas sp.]|jgi:SAM-dependent methyltransferase